MADGVVLNSGSGGVTAATDDCGVAGHAQVIKLAISTDGSATFIPADTTNGLDVDVTRVIPGTTATALGKAEDAAHSSGDTGVMILAVRNDTRGALATTDGDYSPPQLNASGDTRTELSSIAGTAADTNSGNKSAGTLRVVIATDQPALTNKLLTTPDLPSGASTAAKQPALGTAGTASADVITVQGIASMTPILATATLTAGTNTNEVVGDVAHDAVAAGNPVLVGAFASAAAPTDVSADADAVRLWALRSGALAQQPTFAGVLAVAGNGASGTGVQRVTVANDSTGILAGVTTVTTVTTVSTLTGGGVAHDGADSGNPVKIGAKASATLSDDTMVANGDRTDATSDVDGALLVRGQFPLGDLTSERVSNTDGASTAFTNFGAVASTRSYITAYSVFRTDNGTTPIYVDFRDGAAGAVLWSVVLPPNGGANLASSIPLFRTSANTALAFDVSAATTTVYISVTGFKSKV